jgi:hypothetical protein
VYVCYQGEVALIPGVPDISIDVSSTDYCIAIQTYKR